MALKTLNSEHYIAIKYLAQPNRGGLMLEEIAKECGVHVNTLYNWRKDPLFESELKKEIMRETVAYMPEIMASIPGHIINDGNAAMFRTFLQAHGMLTERHEVEAKTSGDSVDMADIRARIAAHRGEGDKA